MYYVKVINTYSKDVYVKECKKNQVSDRIVGDFWETYDRDNNFRCVTMLVCYKYKLTVQAILRCHVEVSLFVLNQTSR